MSTEEPAFNMPPVRETASGNPRRVGFELEFSGLTLQAAANAVAQALGGELQQDSAAEMSLHHAQGRFNIEIDWDFLKRHASESGAKEGGESWLDLLGQVAALVVPIEVVCPPLPLDRLPMLQALVPALRDAGARGTEESLIAAYGVHINAEIPRLDAETLFGYLRAFALLQWWLVDAHKVDIARRASPYIDLYPEAYVRLLCEQKQPSMDDIFSDYLQYNASRNRALDLLPLLAEIDETRVRRAVDDPRIKPRPAFHYRLPNCQIEKPDWSLASSWNTWCAVEALAAQPELQAQLGEAFLARSQPILGVNRNQWTEFVEQWLNDHALV
ncbi:amidoligase family protein [Microbulbifer salipaludis]|uniref:Amidoligase family protein n=1 Tax=Microbulbifer salipaludis TaxID=187980 RepID=A0ABS3E9U1_9GAMM|nr:amidoligase family protein [Microbulbifer salipaludis]MBN8432080.1 amidoligase family protein [Microbulbifer salipaludis]